MKINENIVNLTSKLCLKIDIMSGRDVIFFLICLFAYLTGTNGQCTRQLMPCT